MKRTPIRRTPSVRPWKTMFGYVISLGRCEIPNCKIRDLARLTPHHVKKRSQGGTDETWGPDRNIVALCREHHNQADRGAFTFTRHDGDYGWTIRSRHPKEQR